MDHEMLANIFMHQLKGIMFHADAYCVSVLHGYRRLKMQHCKAAKSETANFMMTRYKSIEYLGEIIDIPAVTRLEVPHDASEHDIVDMWLKWETEAVELYAKAVAAEPQCHLWSTLHQAAANEIKCITKMYLRL